jgi:hypothetical protein
MQLLAINSVSQADEDGVFIVNARLVDIEGIEADEDYVLRLSDQHGLAPAIRQEIGWTDETGPHWPNGGI